MTPEQKYREWSPWASGNLYPEHEDAVDEMEVIEFVHDAMSLLPQDAQRRVLTYVADRLGHI